MADLDPKGPIDVISLRRDGVARHEPNGTAATSRMVAGSPASGSAPRGTPALGHHHDMSAVKARAAFLRTFRWSGGHADLAAVFADAGNLSLLGPALAGPFSAAGVTIVVAPEARGFVLGALCAENLGVGLLLARKPGCVHPGEKTEVVSGPDWREREVTFRLARILTSADVVLLVDDWIQTGSQARAIKEAVESSGACFAGASVIVDETTPDARVDLNVASLVRSADLPPIP